MSKFLVITTQTNCSQLLEGFSSLHIFNVAIVNNQKISILNPFFGHYELEEFPAKNLNSILFPDKLKNLNNRKLKIAITMQIPKTFAYNLFDTKIVFSKYKKFLEIIKSSMNTDFDYQIIESLNENLEIYIRDINEVMTNLRTNLQVDLCISDFFVFNDQTPKLTTYEPAEICALLELPPAFAIYEQILILPFEKIIWISLLISVASCALIWKAYEKFGVNDGCGKFIFGIFGYFLGQSTKFER